MINNNKLTTDILLLIILLLFCITTITGCTAIHGKQVGVAAFTVYTVAWTYGCLYQVKLSVDIYEDGYIYGKEVAITERYTLENFTKEYDKIKSTRKNPHYIYGFLRGYADTVKLQKRQRRTKVEHD